MQHIGFILAGFAVVMGVLALLWGIMALIGRAFTGRPQPEPTAPPGVPPHHLAAIAAAVAVMTDGRGRVVHVEAAPHLSRAWAQQGRADQFASHRVRWDWAVPGPPHLPDLSKGPEGTP